MLHTKDLILHAGSREDGPDLHRNLWGRPEVFRYLFTRPCADPEAGLKKTAAYTKMHEAVPTEFFVYDRATGQAIGIAGIKELQPSHWTVTDVAIGPAFQGKGYGHQIVQALLSLAFEEYGASEVAYDCFEDNEASRRLAISCGFSYTHSTQGELPKDGSTVVLDFYRITRKEYLARKC